MAGYTDYIDYAEFYSDTGATVLSMRSITREGNQLVMVGKLMGAWESTIYIPPKTVLRVIGKLFNPKVVWFVISLPFLLLKHEDKG